MFNSRALTECEIESFCAVKIDTIINCKQNGPELIVNGDFKKGNTDFTTDYTYNSTSGMNEGVYTVRNDIPPWHYQFSDCKDHTTGSTNMMIVNGYSYTSNKRVWEQNIKLEKGKNYEFSIWCLHVCYANLSKAKLRFFINKIPIGPDFQLKVTNCAWQNYRTTFYSNSDSNSVLTIIDANLEGSGNDFAIDDISLHECISANPPEITYNDDCYKLTGIAKVSDSDTTNFSNIAITSDVNVKFNVENYTGKKQIGFTAELLDYRQDGKFNIDVTDSFLITTSKLIEIPGFTVGIKGNELKEPIIAIDSAINSTKKILFPFTIVNYGKFDQNITGFLFNNSCFTTDITAPVNLKPGDTLKFNVVYLSSTPTFINDTLKIQNKCGTRPIVQLNINYSGCGGNSFVFSDFLNVNNLNLIGAASKCDSVIRLTQQVRNQVGAMWYSNKVQINKSFTTSFKFRISKGDNSTSNENSLPGADGITFVVQDYSNTAKGGSGGEIGYGGIPKSLAVEFDLFANDANQIEDFKDPNGNHLAVQSNGINPNTARHNDTTTLGINNNLLTIKSDSTIYIVKIDYNIKPGSMRIFIGTDENILKLSLVIDSLDIPKLLVLDDYKNAYIGITSATGDAYEIHDILYWDFCSEFITDIEDNSMKELKTNIDLNIYPNPNNGIFNLSLKNADISDVIISDVLGNIIYRDRTNTENKSINLSFQPKGVYFVKVVSGKNIDIIKIIVD